jgi:hypothetical protein
VESNSLKEPLRVESTQNGLDRSGPTTTVHRSCRPCSMLHPLAYHKMKRYSTMGFDIVFLKDVNVRGRILKNLVQKFRLTSV